MKIRIRESGQVVSDSEFRSLYPTTSFTTQLSEETINTLGADIVFEGPNATGGTQYQYSQESGVEQIDGKWYTKHILGPVFTDIPATDTVPAKTAVEQEADYKTLRDEQQAASVRLMRTNYLHGSDWTQITDATVNKAAWATYRQALRDVPNQSGFPWNVTWPDTP